MDITTVEFGKRYYHLNDDMKSWCVDNVGPGGWTSVTPADWDVRNWAMFTMFGNTTFYFKNEHDATVFALRWK
jgi:hypothetical protein